jgi:hypothetical protein
MFGSVLRSPPVGRSSSLADMTRQREAQQDKLPEVQRCEGTLRSELGLPNVRDKTRSIGGQTQRHSGARLLLFWVDEIVLALHSTAAQLLHQTNTQVVTYGMGLEEVKDRLRDKDQKCFTAMLASAIFLACITLVAFCSLILDYICSRIFSATFSGL